MDEISMKSINDQLSEQFGQPVSDNSQELNTKDSAAVVDFKMVTFSLAEKDYAIDIMHVKEIAKAGRLPTYLIHFRLFLVFIIFVEILFLFWIYVFSLTSTFRRGTKTSLKTCLS